MKKLRLLFILLFISSFSFAASSPEATQIVIPKTVFLGDRVEIKYIFHSDADFLPEAVFEKNSSHIQLSTEYNFFNSFSENFSVIDAFVEKAGSEYVLSMTLIPWKAGSLSIPPFDLTSYIRFSLNLVGNGISFPVRLDTLQVHSTVEKNGTVTFMPPASPQLLPGTTAIIAVFSGIFIIIISALVYFASKLPYFSSFIEKIILLFSLKKNSRTAIKSLSKLLKTSAKIESDKEYAEKLQRILRTFLKNRFERDFQAISTGAMYEEFLDIAGGELSDSQIIPVEKTIEIFTRTDYVRFSKDAHFLGEERTRLSRSTMKLVFDFDRAPDDQNEDEEEEDEK